MQIKATIKKGTGIVINEVVDRQQHACSQVYVVTSRLGRQLSDEEIGPETNDVHEVETDN